MKKNLTMVAAVAACAALLAGCGNEAATTATNTASTEATTDASAEATTDAAQEAQDDSGITSATPIDITTLETVNLVEVNASDYVTLGDYTGLTVEVPAKKEITDEDVEAKLHEVYEDDPQYVDATEGVIESGDIANIDFVGKYADTKEAFEGGTGEGYDLKIGSHSFIDGFEDGLIGVNIGDTVDLNLTFPEDYQAPNLAGVDVIFTVTVNSAQKMVAEPSDEWVAAKGLEDAANLEEFKAQLREELVEDEENNYLNNVKNAVMDAAIANASFEELPEKLYNRFLVQQYQDWNMQATWLYYMYQVQLTPEQIAEAVMQQNGMVGSVDDYIKDVVTTNARDFVLLQAIADKEGLGVADDELEELFKAEYEQSSSASSVSYEDYKASSDIENYRDTTMANRVLDFMVESANVVETQE